MDSLTQPFVQKGQLLPCGASSETGIVGQHGTEMADQLSAEAAWVGLASVELGEENIAGS